MPFFRSQVIEKEVLEIVFFQDQDTSFSGPEENVVLGEAFQSNERLPA
jgi:hypothetical protein